MRIRSVVTHSAQAVAEGALIALLVVGLAAGTTFAAKGGGGGASTGGGGHHGGGGGTTGGSATIVVPNGVFGQTDVATVTPAGLWVYASCKQGTQQVYAQYVLSDASGHATLTLGPTYYWTGGSASCIANAGTFDAISGAWSTAGSTSFSVAAS